VLSRIAQDQLALVQAMSLPKVVILGVGSGNGLEHVDPVRCRSVVGIDINAELLAVCRERYAGLLPMLRLHQLDLRAEKGRAISLLADADLVTANLLVEHLWLDDFLDIVRDLERPIISVTIQVNPDGSLVSRSGHEAAFDDIAARARECREDALLESMGEAGFVLDRRTAYPLPNGKSLLRLDLRRIR
jgi:trans-aconitate methyltransferase